MIRQRVWVIASLLCAAACTSGGPSEAVLNADGTAALVYVEVTCEVLCGTGWLVELRKEQGRWQVVRRDTRWIS